MREQEREAGRGGGGTKITKYIKGSECKLNKVKRARNQQEKI